MITLEKSEIDEILKGVTNVEIFDKDERLFCTISKYKFDGPYHDQWTVSMFDVMNLTTDLQWVPIENLSKKEEMKQDSILKNFHWGTLQEAYRAVNEKIKLEEKK